MPRFSIVITSYNSEAFIGEAVDSALEQSHAGREVIVVDDASTDHSIETLRKYGEAITLLPLSSNGGAGAARNQGASLAKGDYLVFLDGDDRLLPWALDVYSRIIDAESPKLILCTMLYFRDSFSTLGVLNRPKAVALVAYESFMKKDRPYRASASAMVVERQCFQRVQGFSTDMFPIEDADLMVKLGDAGKAVSIVSPQTTGYRQHANNASLRIQGLIDGVHKVILKEKAGQYPGGPPLRGERYGVLGGIAFSWLRRTLRERMYREFRRLLAASWSMVLTAMLRRVVALLCGRRPVETLSLPAESEGPAP